MIHQLDRVVAAQIVAGEVIERPASVVRELIENAIDAKATQIHVDYWAAGLRAIRVRDNGIGMQGDQIERAFARHTTSKLVQVEDLWSIGTLGFRGEALPSIAAIAQVTCISRVAGAECGYELRIAGGDVQGYRAVSAPVGSCVWVRQLFYNTPQRRAFLRSAAAEAAAIAVVVGQYALAYPEVAFVLAADERNLLQTYGDGDLRSVLAVLEGIDLVHQLVPVALIAGADGQAIRIEGWVSQPSISRHTRAGINIFVNRRIIQPRGGMVAVIDEAYRGLLPPGRFPFVVLNLTTPYSEVDINAHPTKSEVKFRDPARLLSLLSRALRDGLFACVLESPMPTIMPMIMPTIMPTMAEPALPTKLFAAAPPAVGLRMALPTP
jgi:DNA mismatch repair protein MutL